ncbi:phosphoribosyltransferase family protein [Cupriavidus basilensis]|uniref:phosphoribosyltransferase family protein n=1 Tax=Cupriavidus basilensis TaxID=68895 RepID=UPI00157AABB3|nr:phosphoribosyltransferase family protein [Cupriavidus basilensis]
MSSPLARFASREEAAAQLAEALSEYRGQRPLILAIPKGGVPIGRGLADALEGQLDVALVSKLIGPDNDVAAVGAVTENGWTYRVKNPVGGQPAPMHFAQERLAKLDLLKQQCAIYTSQRARLDPHGRIVILVDDGLCTGATMMAAIHAVRRRQPAWLVCAVPVGTPQGLASVRASADEVVCLNADGPHHDVRRAYQCFPEVDDGTVRALLWRDIEPRNAEAIGSKTLATAVPVGIPCDGIRLYGVLDAPASPVGLVLMVHANGIDDHAVRNQYVARKLCARGLATLLVDLIGPREAMRAEKRRDIAMLAGRLRVVMQAVPGYVHARLRLPAVPLGCFATGSAAAAALTVAAEEGTDLRALVLAAGRVDLADANTLGSVTIPTLLVVGAGDPEGIRRNDLVFGRLRCPRQLRLVAGEGRIFEEPAAIEELAMLTGSWFSQLLADGQIAVV